MSQQVESPESDAGACLHLILFFDHPPRRRPWFWDSLAGLAEQQALILTAVYNGQPYNLDAQLSGLKLRDFQSLSLPLRLEPEQALSALLEDEKHLPAAVARLWLSAETLWSPASLATWLAQLAEYPVMMPMCLPAGQKQLRRQFQARVFCSGEPGLVTAGLIRLPPCLLWRSDQDQKIRTQGLSEQRVNIDLSSYLWAEPPPPASDPSLDRADAELLWQAFRQTPAVGLLDDLLARTPGSPRLYPFASRLLAPELALDLLARGFMQGLLSPMMLQAAEALLAKNQPVSAEACRALLAGRFGQGSLNRWTDFSGWADCLPRRASLSVCLIVRDEANMLTDCLKSVKPVADELIVVDTGSQDGTPVLAKELGARVFERVWPEDFSAARNWSLDYASSDWILVIDADQRLEADSLAQLDAFLWEPLPGLPRGQVAIKNLSDQGQVSLIHFESRLFPAVASLRYRGRIHEEVLLQGPGFSPSPLIEGVSMLHWGYVRERLISKDKARRNVDLLLKQQAEEPEQAHWMTYLADSLSALGEHETALGWYRRVLEAWDAQVPARPVQKLTLLRTLSQMSNLLLKLRRFQDVLALAERYEAEAEAVPDFWYVRGLAYLECESLPQAEACFWKCLSFRDHPERLEGLASAYTPDCTDSLPLQQLLLLEIARFRRSTDAGTLLSLFKQWTQAGCATSPALPHPLLYWAEVALLSPAQQLPELPQALRLSPAGQGILLALVWLDSAYGQVPEQSWIQSPADNFVWAELDSGQRQAICHQLWQSADARSSWMAQALLYLDFVWLNQLDQILLLAQLSHSAGQPDLALQWIQAARQRRPDEPLLLNNEAMLLFESGRSERACRQLELCLKIAPGFVDAQNNLQGIRNWQKKQNLVGP